MQIFRYKADIIPITLFVLFFLCDILVYSFVADIGLLLTYVALTMIPRWFICPWNHHHQHTVTFDSPILNRILEVIYGFQTGITGYAWVLHHNLGHHVHYLDQSQDESAWKSPDGKIYSPLQYTWIVAMTAYTRAWKVGTKYKQIQKYFLGMGLLQILMLIVLIIYNPVGGILIFIIPMITGLFVTAYTTYYQHSGLESSDPYEASYNIRDRWYNLLTGNLGYHTAHHIRATLHWSKLPDLHREIKDKIDSKYYLKNNFFYYSKE